MRVLVQWALDTPGDWEEIDSADWSSLPRRGVPTGTDSLDGRKGWVNAVNVQGVRFQGDSLTVEDVGSGAVRVTQVNDDPDDWPSGEEHARVITLEPLQADPGLGGAINTKQTQIIYAGAAMHARLQAAGLPQNTTLLPWSAFTAPSPSLSRHGIWMPDATWEAHRTAQAVRGWREWTDGLDPSEVQNGKLRAQRVNVKYLPPSGTRTYYHRNTDQAIGAVAGDNENVLTTGVGISVTENASANPSTLGWAAATTSAQPASAAWPTGVYRAQLDVTAADADLEYGVLTLGGVHGRFYRLNFDLSSVLEEKSQAESAFILTGLKLATTGSVSWTAGSALDRWGYSVALNRTTGHGPKTMNLQLNETDDFTDGPWPAAVVATDNAPFFGCNF